jgi:predicted 2-oxoglutarate/Fe(II)-dependent dioxygenase YbiX
MFSIFSKNKDYSKEDFLLIKEDIAIVDNFVSKKEAKNMIDFFKMEEQQWGPIAFYGSQGMGFAPKDERLLQFNLEENFFENLRNKFKNSCEVFFERKLKSNTSHAQKWEIGGFANPHSDSSDLDGNLNSFQINKYVGILYLNDDYEGGVLYFPDHDIKIKPKSGDFVMFPGGIENVHGVSEITKGSRYTMVSFWDYEESEYDEETKNRWKKEESLVRIEQENKRKEWEKGNKNA